MLNPSLYKSPALLDATAHRSLRLRQDVKSIRCAEGVNLVFIGISEFETICKEFPILFVSAGKDALGRPQVAPVAVMGLQQGENSYLTIKKNGHVEWQSRYVPAFLRLYPFSLTQVDQGRWGMCIDEAWRGWSTTSGEALFADDGAPLPWLTQMQENLQHFEREIEATRIVGERLMHLGLLAERQFNVSLPDGSSYSMADFLAVDDERLAALSKMEVSALHRSGALHCLSLHRASLGNLDELARRRWRLGQMAGA